MVGGIDPVALGLKRLQVWPAVEDLVDMEKEEKLVEGVCRAEAGLRIRIPESCLSHESVAPAGRNVVEVAACDKGLIAGSGRDHLLYVLRARAEGFAEFREYLIAELLEAVFCGVYSLDVRHHHALRIGKIVGGHMEIQYGNLHALYLHFE